MLGLFMVFRCVIAALLDGAVHTAGVAAVFHGCGVVFGLARSIIFERLPCCFALVPRCVVGGRLKPAELVDLALGFTRALLGRWRRGRALLGFYYGVLADAGAVPPDRLAKVRERPIQACIADRDVIEMHTVGLFIREDSLTRRRQAIRFLSPIRMIRYLGDRNIEALRRALKGGVIAHVPFGRIKIVRDVFPRREIPLVIFERPDQGRPCLGQDIPVIRERLHARHPQGFIGLQPVRLCGFRVCCGRPRIGRSRGRTAGRRCRRGPLHRLGTPVQRCMIVLQRQLALPQLRPRLLFRPLFSLPFDPMHVAHRGRAPVASRAGMEILEGIEIFAPDTTAKVRPPTTCRAPSCRCIRATRTRFESDPISLDTELA